MMRCWVLLVSLVLLPCVRAAELAPAAEYEGKTVGQIRFEPESQPVARADLARLMSLKPGSAAHLADIRNAIKQLYSTGRYDSVEVRAEPAGEAVNLIFHTTEQWFVGAVEVTGKVKLPPNEGQLANATRFQLGTPFGEEDVKSAMQGMNDLLQRNGLYQSKIIPEIERDSEHQQVALTFRVDTGKRARFTLPVVFGDTRLSAEELAKAAKYKRRLLPWWKLATEENTQRGLKNIRDKYQDDERLTASVQLDRLEYLPQENRVRPHIEADGGPKISIKTEGAKVSRKNLEKYVPVFTEETVNRDLLVRGVGNLRDYFQNRGYFNAQVDFRTTDQGADRQSIVFQIDPGRRHKVARVAVEGNRYFRTEDIRERMFIQPAGFLVLRRGRFSSGLANRDRDSIVALYRSNGFRDAQVTINAAQNYMGKTGDVGVTVEIEEGPQYRVSAIELDGITRYDKSAFLARLASIPGEPFSETNVALDRDYLLNVYQSAGFPEVSFDWRMQPGPAPNEVSLRYVVTEGQPRYVRDVLITGLRETSRRLVDPNILLKPGDPLSWTQMGEVQRRLYELGIFDKVDMAVQNQGGNTENKYVLYHLTEGHRYYVGIGAGARAGRIGGNQDSLDNPGGSTGVSPRADLDVSRLNMFGLGHSLIFHGRYSTLDRRLSLEYLAPRYRNVDGRNFSVTALYDNTRDVLTFQARRLEGRAQITQRFSKATNAIFRYTWRNVQVNQGTLKINPLLVPLQSQPARIAMISANVVQDRRDDPSDARRGIFNSADLGLVGKYLGGNRNFLRFLGQNSYYRSFAHHYVLASNTKFGWIRPFSVSTGTTPLDYIPISERFYGGGSYEHRGFPDFHAGLRDPLTGFPIGGNALLFHQTELRFPMLGDNITGVLFHDMGNIFRDLSSVSLRVHQRELTDFDYMVHAAGFGVRYRTPIGPVRVDLAYSINPPRFNGLKGSYQDLLFGRATPQVQNVSHFQFFFSIGQAF